MRFVVAIAVALGLMLTVVPAFAQQAEFPRVSTTVDPTSGTVGEHFKLKVEASVPDLTGLQVMPLFDTQTSWTVVGDPAVTEGASGNLSSRNYAYTIVPFETGQVPLPQVAVTYNPSDGGTSNTVLSASDWVEVNSVLSGNGTASALRDVKPPVPLPIPPAVVWSGTILLLLILLFLGYLLWRRYSARLRGMLGRSLTPPELALKEIDSLEEERLIEHKKVKELYTRLSDTVRQYLETAYGVQAAELTSNELLREMDELAEEQPQEQEQNYRQAMARLVELLDESDLVKFARLLPDAPRCRRALQAGRDIVTLTSYRFAPQDDENNKRNSAPPSPPTDTSSHVHAGVS